MENVTAVLQQTHRFPYLFLIPLLPFLGAIIAVLFLVAFVPETVLLIPRLLGFIK